MMSRSQPKRPESHSLGQSTSKGPFGSPAQIRHVKTDSAKSIDTELSNQSTEASGITRSPDAQEGATTELKSGQEKAK